MPATVKSAADTILRLRFGLENFYALSAVLLFTLVPLTVIYLYHGYTSPPDRSTSEVAVFLNTTTSPDAIIETYDMELFVLLKRRYSYPPDDVTLRLIRRLFMGQNVEVYYDPMARDPDYLVVGPSGRLSRLYDPILRTGSFRLILERSRYQVYERIRPVSSLQSPSSRKDWRGMLSPLLEAKICSSLQYANTGDNTSAKIGGGRPFEIFRGAGHPTSGEWNGCEDTFSCHSGLQREIHDPADRVCDGCGARLPAAVFASSG